MQYFASGARLALASLMAIAAPRAFAAEAANLLTNSGAEQTVGAEQAPPGWFAAQVPATGLRMWRDTEHSRAGNACLAIANDHDYDQTVCNNWLQEVPKVPAGKTVRLSAYLRTDNAEAVNVCVQCWAKGGQQLVGFVSTPVFRDTHGWTLVQADELTIPADTAQLMVRAVLTGKGKAYFDDLLLEVVEPTTGGTRVGGSRHEARAQKLASRPVTPNASPNDELAAQVSGRIVRRLPVTADQMILAYLPQWNHGRVDNVGVDNNDGGVRTLVTWQPPSNEELARPNARFLLAMYARDTKLRDNPGKIGVHEVLGDWDESTSWQRQPLFAEKPASEHGMIAGQGWKLFDVTSLVRQAKSPDGSHGIILRFAEEQHAGSRDDWSGYAMVSREAIGEWQWARPVLLVVEDTGGN